MHDKTVELRGRRVHIEKGACIWLYASTPSKALLGRAWVEAISIGSPRDQWRRFGSNVGLNEEEYLDRFSGCSVVCAIQLRRIERFQRSLYLKDIRRTIPAFQPPQSYYRIQVGSTVEKLFTKHAISVGAVPNYATI